MRISPYKAIWTTSNQTKPRNDATEVSWPWKLAAASFAALQLVGYMMLAVIIGYPHELRIDATATNVCAFVFIGVSHAMSVLIAFAHQHRLRFLLQSIFIPCSMADVLALLNILFHIHGRGTQMNTLPIVGICLPTAFAVCYATAAMLIYRECCRHPGEESTLLLSDEELQRRQLLRLLGEQNHSAPSPELVRNTYRFDLPQDEAAQKYWNSPATPL
ncbi:hypothetical protein N7457_005196 [Penicillium paradoxum]|uniref:uncharacterized protein n=1 Tax=Penicillium paradoxum TaxID=176176 RepID=UPI0025479CFD|nr:uncharacterized protein N7457_005196 [Penicillium paradoxum]KAJ5780036.1 hypothetical protein N7457_005196 [Penicillium paradoxum]